MYTISQRWILYLVLSAVLAAAYFVYRPGLNGPFVFDDYVNILGNKALAIQDLDLQTLRGAALSGNSGPLMRPISMVSFALNYYATDNSTGWNPYFFKLTNLAIHIANGLCIFVLTTIILGVYRKKFEPNTDQGYLAWASLAVAGAWVLHPLNLTSVLYVVQRMTSLAALFTLLALISFTWGRRRLYDGESGVLPMLASTLLFLPLAVMCKENGVLLPMYMLAIEITFFGLHTRHRADRGFLVGYYAIFLALPAVIGFTFIATSPEWLLTGYQGRDFTMYERVLTECRVIWFYMSQILLPSNAQMGLYHDDIAISKSLLNPVSTIVAAVALAILVMLIFVSRKKFPLIAFGLMFYLFGQLLESTILPLEIAHEHRNYLPMYGLILIFFFYLIHPLRFPNNIRLRQAGAILLIGMFAYNTYARAIDWANPIDLFESEVLHHPNSAMSNGELGALYSNIFSPDSSRMEANFLVAKGYFEQAAHLSQNDTKPFFGLIMLSVSRNRSVDSNWLIELSRRLEVAPYASVTSDKLLDLTKCQLSGVCKLKNEQFEMLLQAALRNHSLAGANRAKVLYAFSSYLINEKRDYDAALDVMAQMIVADPEERAFRIPLIRFLLAIHRNDEARNQLAILKGMDSSGNYVQEIENLEAELATQY